MAKCDIEVVTYAIMFTSNYVKIFTVTMEKTKMVLIREELMLSWVGMLTLLYGMACHSCACTEGHS
jgi:hypothetical protein